jgi:hypothetical protein
VEMDANEEENEEEETVDKLKLVEIISFFCEIVYIDHISACLWNSCELQWCCNLLTARKNIKKMSEKNFFLTLKYQFIIIS